jgi:hypothetical protein
MNINKDIINKIINTNKTNNFHNDNSRAQVRLHLIARRCAEQFLAEVRKSDYVYRKGAKENGPASRKTSFRNEFRTAFNGSAPTVNDFCRLARKHNFLLLLRIESEQHSVQIRIDPLRRTASQLSRTVADCCSWMRLDAAGEKGDREDKEGDDDSEEDENPIPGHEDEEEDDDATDDNGWGDDGGGNEDRDEDDPANDDDDRDEDGDSDDGYDDDDDDDDEDDKEDDEDDEEDDNNDSTDNVWALKRLIEIVDDADLRLSIHPARRSNYRKYSREKVTLTTIHPPRKRSELISRFPWWSKRTKQMCLKRWSKTSCMFQIQLTMEDAHKSCLREITERWVEEQKKAQAQTQRQTKTTNK